MTTKKSFIAISSVIHNNKLVSLQTSAGDNISNNNGINFEIAIDFLFSLIKYRKKSGVVFVTFGAVRDNEVLFSTMPRYLRDKLFQSHTVANEVNTLATELEEIENVYYNADKLSQEFQRADFEKYVLNQSIQENLEVRYKDYKLTLRNGKFLTINKKGRSLTIYDIYGFFKKNTLRSACETWLGLDVPKLDKQIFVKNARPSQSEIEVLRDFARLECEYTGHLASNLNSRLQAEGINISKFYAPSAVASYFLNKWKAKDDFHNYRYKRQYSPALWEAVNGAYQGGRSEQFKLGTIKNVNIYDINSAYAYAITFLPQMLKKPYFVKGWKPKRFGLFFCEFDFTGINPYFGLLPFRSANNNITYPLCGSGWYPQPEVSFIVEHYPECINIKHGFVLDYKPISFSENIGELYNLRLRLKAENNPLEKIIKLTLSSLYGKFAQELGKQKYYNKFYAGYITSITRRQLLEATKGYEKETVCFQTDAIHTTANLESQNISISSKLGAYKLSEYNAITYIDNGVYQDALKQKTKTRGLKDFNFKDALSDINEYQNYNANARVFIGHNLFTLRRFGRKAEYLNLFDLHKKFYPSRDIEGRIFENKQIDFLNEYLDSLPIDKVSDEPSKSFSRANFMQSNVMSGLEVVRV